MVDLVLSAGYRFVRLQQIPDYKKHTSSGKDYFRINPDFPKIKFMSFNIKNIPYSILELASVSAGSNPQETFKNSLDLARKAEELGYTRFWLAEHHNMVSIASSATAVLNWLYCRRHKEDQGGIRRHHAAQPFAADCSRAVWHPGFHLSK
jgi:hypothetical protein